VFLLFPLERLWGDLLGVMDAARRNVSVLLINHRVGRTCVHTHTDTHTRERRRKENEGRKNELSRISLADDGRVTGEREKNNHQHTFPPWGWAWPTLTGSSNLSNSIDFKTKKQQKKKETFLLYNIHTHTQVDDFKYWLFPRTDKYGTQLSILISSKDNSPFFFLS
jgi:hypothetical protein